MAVPVLHLNLAPRPSLWRQRHLALGWAALGLGILILLGAVGFTWRSYHQASKAGRDAISLTAEAHRAAKQEQQIQASLQEMDVSREQSRWKLAERILQERSLPWSRLTTELEQCMVPDMRLKGFQRSRSNTQQVMMKLKGEARTREAEVAFVEALRAAPVFAQVVMERESERAGGGWDFELSLPAAAVPPPFQFKAIKTGPARVETRPVAVAAPRSAAPVATPPKPVVTPRPVTPAPVPPRISAPGPAAMTPGPWSKGNPDGLRAQPVPTGDDETPGRLRRPGRLQSGNPRIRPTDTRDSQ